MDYSKYKQSQNASWQILIDHDIRELPVKVSSICRSLNIPVISYEKGIEMIKTADLLEECKKNDGFTSCGCIFYNQDCTVGRQRFTVAHELAHIIMHTKSKYNREPYLTDNRIEHEANVFASRLLAPACVLWGLGVTTAEQIAAVCDISLTSARFRMERLSLLYDRNKFLTSPLERKVYEQFWLYILKNKL